MLLSKGHLGMSSLELILTIMLFIKGMSLSSRCDLISNTAFPALCSILRQQIRLTGPFTRNLDDLLVSTLLGKQILIDASQDQHSSVWKAPPNNAESSRVTSRLPFPPSELLHDKIEWYSR